MMLSPNSKVISFTLSLSWRIGELDFCLMLSTIWRTHVLLKILTEPWPKISLIMYALLKNHHSHIKTYVLLLNKRYILTALSLWNWNKELDHLIPVFHFQILRFHLWWLERQESCRMPTKLLWTQIVYLCYWHLYCLLRLYFLPSINWNFFEKCKNDVENLER